MPRKFFQRFLPKPQTIKENKLLQIFGDWLHKPNLWHLNRRSVAGAFAVGLFFAWMPIPFQMLLAAGAAIWIGTNLPLSISIVWLTNPITIPPMFYFAYVVGTWIVGEPVTDFNFELTFDWLLNELSAIWKPFLVGCLTLAISSSLIGYVTISGLWRYLVVTRRSSRLNRKKYKK
ncbi:MAG: ATP-binding protein [Gammaproteobacteria bacterium]|nr:MAG: ATP-binding protein [Gammaproteobacteria bacterium]